MVPLRLSRQRSVPTLPSEGLKEAGYVDGQNVVIEYRWANGQYDRLTALAERLVRSRSLSYCRDQYSCEPRGKGCHHHGSDCFHNWRPIRVELGLVTSLGRPGGNVTGVTQMTGEVAPKRVELAHRAGNRRQPLLVCSINPTNPLSENVKRDLQAAALKTRTTTQCTWREHHSELDKAFTTFPNARRCARHRHGCLLQ